MYFNHPVITMNPSVLLLTLGVCLPLFASAQVTVHLNDRPPYTFLKDGRLSGLTGAPTAAAFEAAGVAYTLAITPTARQLAIIKNNTGLDCLASGAFKNEERESYGKFTRPIYRDKARIALSSVKNTKVKNGQTIESVLGNRAITLLVKQGYSYGKVFDDLLDTLQPTRITVTVESIQMLKMIQANRADLMLISQEEADGLIAIADVNPDEIRKISFSNAPSGEHRYIFCSRSVPDEIIHKLNSAIK